MKGKWPNGNQQPARIYSRPGAKSNPIGEDNTEKDSSLKSFFDLKKPPSPKVGFFRFLFFIKNNNWRFALGN